MSIYMSSLFSLLTIVIVTGLMGFYYCGKRAYSLYLRISGDVLNKTDTPILPFVDVGKNLLITNRLHLTAVIPCLGEQQCIFRCQSVKPGCHSVKRIHVATIMSVINRKNGFRTCDMTFFGICRGD